MKEVFSFDNDYGVVSREGATEPQRQTQKAMQSLRAEAHWVIKDMYADTVIFGPVSTKAELRNRIKDTLRQHEKERLESVHKVAHGVTVVSTAAIRKINAAASRDAHIKTSVIFSETHPTFSPKYLEVGDLYKTVNGQVLHGSFAQRSDGSHKILSQFIRPKER